MSVASAALQAPITFQGGQGWDGLHYYQLAQAFAGHNIPAAGAPFVYRLGTPLLASWLNGADLLAGFRLANIIAGFLGLVLLLVWLRFFIAHWQIRLLLAILFVVWWLGPVRFTYYYPVYVDPWAIVLLLLGLIAVHLFQQKPGALRLLAVTLISFVGVIFRDVLLAVPLALFIAELSLGQRPAEKLIQFGKRLIPPTIPLVFGLAATILVHLVATSTNDYSFLGTLINWIYEKSLASYIHGWFIVFGIIILLPILSFKSISSFLLRHRFQLVFLALIALLAWIGGSDIERLLYFSMPVVYVLIGLAIEQNLDLLRRSRWLVLALVVSMALSARLFWSLPDYPNAYRHQIPLLTPIGNVFPALDVYASHGDQNVELVSLVQYLLLSAALIFYWYRLKARSGAQTQVN